MSLNREALRAAYLDQLRALYASRTPAREVTPFDLKVAELVFGAATAALTDDPSSEKLKVVSAPTGAGKSSCNVAFGAALVLSDPTASVAYVVKTIQQAEDTYRELLRLLEGKVGLVVYTSAHNANEDPNRISWEFGLVPSQRFTARDLNTARVIVVTDTRLTQEVKAGGERVRFYTAPNGVKARRDLLFIDELPSIAAVYETSLAEIETLATIASSVDQTGTLAPVIVAAHERLAAVNPEAPKGSARFQGLDEIIPAIDAATIREWDNAEGHAALAAARKLTPEAVANALGFLRAASRGFAFIARYQQGRLSARLMGYSLSVEYGSNAVLSDATAEVSGFIAISPLAQHVGSVAVDHSALTITHVAPPPTVVPPKTMLSRVLQEARRARPYADWITEQVRQHSTPGEKVLVVVHDRLLQLGLLPWAKPENLNSPGTPWEHREVSVLWWGQGIGSNNWKDHTTVMLFGEFIRPRRVTVGEALGITGRNPTPGNLKGASGSRLTGDFKTVEDGFALRWLRQLAARGSMRNIDGEGRCAPMKLVVWADANTLAKVQGELFPGSPPILWTTKAALTKRSQGDRSQGSKSTLMNALRTRTVTVGTTSAEIADLCGVGDKANLRRLLKDGDISRLAAAAGLCWVQGGGRGNVGRFVSKSALAA
jgi:hypothetical protein